MRPLTRSMAVCRRPCATAGSLMPPVARLILMPRTPAPCMASSSLSGVFSSITATPRHPRRAPSCRRASQIVGAIDARRDDDHAFDVQAPVQRRHLVGQRRLGRIDTPGEERKFSGSPKICVWQSHAPAGIAKFTGVAGCGAFAKTGPVRMATPAATVPSIIARHVGMVFLRRGVLPPRTRREPHSPRKRLAYHRGCARAECRICTTSCD